VLWLFEMQHVVTCNSTNLARDTDHAHYSDKYAYCCKSLRVAFQIVTLPKVMVHAQQIDHNVGMLEYNFTYFRIVI
jgi:hypothetical protein